MVALCAPTRSHRQRRPVDLGSRQLPVGTRSQPDAACDVRNNFLGGRKSGRRAVSTSTDPGDRTPAAVVTLGEPSIGAPAGVLSANPAVA